VLIRRRWHFDGWWAKTSVVVAGLRCPAMAPGGTRETPATTTGGKRTRVGTVTKRMRRFTSVGVASSTSRCLRGEREERFPSPRTGASLPLCVRGSGGCCCDKGQSTWIAEGRIQKSSDISGKTQWGVLGRDLPPDAPIQLLRHLLQ